MKYYRNCFSQLKFNIIIPICRTYGDYNIKLKLTKTIPAIFHNIRGYDTHLIMQEIGKFEEKINVLPSGLEKYMAFTVWFCFYKFGFYR